MDIPLPGTILVVDDNPDSLRLLMHMLSKVGHTVEPVKSGQAALSLITKIDPDIILLDIMMPDIDGFEVCHQLKSDPDTKNIPIIFLSALNELTEKVRAFKFGGIDYITKPYKEAEVLARVENHLALRRLQQQLEEQNTLLMEAQDALETRVDELSSLNLIIQTIASTNDLQIALQIVVTTMTRLFNVLAVTIGLLNEAQTELTLTIQNARHSDEPNMVGVTIAVQGLPLFEKLLHDGETLTLHEVDASPLTNALQPLLQNRQIETIFIIPLISRRGVIGTINLASREPQRILSHDELQLAETVTGQVAGAIENSQLFKKMEHAHARMSHELAVAHDIQQSLLPPPRPGWSQVDVACYTTPAREIGGDFYTYHAITKKRVLVSKHILAVGDVSGKGASAALLMAACLSQFQAALNLPHAPVERMAHLDLAIMPYTKERGQNCALCYVEIVGANTAKPILKIVNAGCIPPYIRQAEGPVLWPDAGGFALGQGLGAKFGYQEVKPPLRKGDVIILTSDGVVEAKNLAGEMLGFERLETIIATGPINTAPAMLTHIKASVLAFMGGNEPHDDITIIVAKI